MEKGLRLVIDENKRELLQGYKEGLCNKQDIEELLKTATEDEEFEVAISIKEVLEIIKNGRGTAFLRSGHSRVKCTQRGGAISSLPSYIHVALDNLLLLFQRKLFRTQRRN